MLLRTLRSSCWTLSAMLYSAAKGHVPVLTTQDVQRLKRVTRPDANPLQHATRADSNRTVFFNAVQHDRIGNFCY